MKQRWVFLAVVVFLIGAGTIVVRQLFSGSATGTISPATVRPTKQAAAVAVDGHYASFTLPADFQAANIDKPAAPVYERYDYLNHQPGQLAELAIQIRQLPTGALADDGSYYYRHSLPARYTATTETVGDQTVQFFSDTSATTFNQVAYVQHGQTGASIALTAGVAPDSTTATQLLHDVLASWHWK